MIQTVLRAMLLALICHGTCVAGPVPCSAPSGPGYFQVAEPRRETLIVFVHGIMGDAVDSWLHTPSWWQRLPVVGNPPVFWPCLLGEHGMFSSASVYLYGYPADLVGRNPGIEALAERMERDLSEGGQVFSRYGHVVFVAHSMGGLVVSRMLMRPGAEDRLGSVRGVLFYGTPALGADIARVALAFSSSLQLTELADKALMRRWTDEWTRRSKGRYWSACQVEEDTISGQLVVEPESAKALCGGQGRMLYGKDHISMVKPVGAGDEPVQVLLNQYALCIAPRLTLRSIDDDDRDREVVRQWLFGLKDRLADAAALHVDDLTPLIRADLHPASILGGGTRYVSPRFEPPARSPTDLELLNSNEFVLAVRDHLLKDLIDARRDYQLEQILRIRHLDKAIGDWWAVQLQNLFIKNASLQQEDFAVLLRSSSNPGRYIMLFASAAPLPDRAGARLKGFVRFAMPTGQCT